MKNQRQFRKNILLNIIMPALGAFYAPFLLAGAAFADDPMSTGEIPSDSPSEASTPALNVVNPPMRQSPPPPPETPQGSQSIALQKGAVPVSLPQSWRQKALLLFKPANGLDRASVAAVHLSSSYRSAFEAVRKGLTDQGLTVEALSLSSGHILVSQANEKGSSDRAIIALRTSAGDSDDNGGGTDARIFCDKNNRTLTLPQIKNIIAQLGGSDQDNKNGAGNL